MKTLGFHHVAIQAREVARVAAFYVDVLELPELARYHRDDGSLRSIWVGVGGDDFLAIEHSTDRSAAGPSLGFSMVALRIAPQSRAHVTSRLNAHQVAIERESGWTVYVRDPEGNLVGLSHHPHGVG